MNLQGASGQQSHRHQSHRPYRYTRQRPCTRDRRVSTLSAPLLLARPRRPNVGLTRSGVRTRRKKRFISALNRCNTTEIARCTRGSSHLNKTTYHGNLLFQSVKCLDLQIMTKCGSGLHAISIVVYTGYGVYSITTLDLLQTSQSLVLQGDL